MIYEWGSAWHPSVSAQVVGDTVERLAKENGGVCPPGLYVEAARAENSDLHPTLTWDNDVCGENWRKQEARQIIKGLRVLVENEEERAPAFVHVTITKDDTILEGYAETRIVVKDSDLRKQALGEAMASLNGLRRRYNALKELAPVWDALDRIAS